MEKLFICLANSRKKAERCIAGIELVKSSRRGYTYDVKTENDSPKWIRPVSDSPHGGVPTPLVKHVNLLDIVKINVTEFIPKGFQSENVLFVKLPLSVVDTIPKDSSLIDKLLSVFSADEPFLFYNTGKAVPVADIGKLNYSLVLIKPANVQVEVQPGGKIRASFVFNDIPYDLPITDIDFINLFNLNPILLKSCTHIYFTISLGVEFKGAHYKLIAGVVYL